MSDCTIEILTRTQEQTQLFRAACVLEKKPSGVFFVRYLQENDKVTLMLSDRAMSMRREGETGLSARFVGGKRTDMKMQFGAGVALVPLYTDEYRMRVYPSGLEATLRYRLITDCGDERFELTITIGNSEEK